MPQEVYIQLERMELLLTEFYIANYDTIFITMGVVLIVLLLGFSLHKAKKIPGEERMKNKGEYVLSKRQQKMREHTLIADGIASLLLDLFVKKELTPERYQYWHLRFGTQLALKELLPVKLTPVQVKEAMRKRIGNGVYKPINFPKEIKKKKQNALELTMAKHITQS